LVMAGLLNAEVWHAVSARTGAKTHAPPISAQK